MEIKTKEVQVNQNEFQKLQEYKEETLWRITDLDVEVVLRDHKYGEKADIPEEVMEQAKELVRTKFNLYNWYEELQEFLSEHKLV